MQDSRRDRNIRLIARLRSLGFDMTLEEAEARGRGMTGRPHFAKIMVEKGYVATRQEAFDRYLDESAIAYVDRLEPQLEEGIGRIADGGGITILPHPVRVGDHARMTELLPEMQAMGLDGVEIYHPDHTEADTEFFAGMARKLRMAVSGGSDFHGELKPGIRLGLGNMPVPRSVLEDLRKAMPPRPAGHPR
jgi:predicted metal-dependent phosphoesterase TrpH